MTALTRNASQTFSTNIHVTFTSPVHIRKLTTGTASQDCSSVLFAKHFFVVIRVHLKNLISRQRSFFFLLLIPKRNVWKGNIKTECDCN
uniref:Uncharacterized protein n=1 Tax=Rhipicephalus zambeziensis TaxID=60191 RepID=A0A224YH27_9ACAR